MRRIQPGIAFIVVAMLLSSSCEPNEPGSGLAPQPESTEVAEIEAPPAQTAQAAPPADPQDDEEPAEESSKTRYYRKPDLPVGPPSTVCELVLPDQTTSPFLTEDNFILDWTILGPIHLSDADIPADETTIDHEYLPNEAELDGTQPASPELAWRSYRFTEGLTLGRVDLRRRWGVAAPAAAYAVTVLDCPRAVEDAALRLGNSDPVKVYLNGREVYTAGRNRQSQWDQAVIDKLSLDKGENRLVVKCVDLGGGMDFYLRLTDRTGRPIRVDTEK